MAKGEPTKGEPLIDRIERLIFGATAQERAELIVQLAEQRLEQRLIAVLDATFDAALADDQRAATQETAQETEQGRESRQQEQQEGSDDGSCLYCGVVVRGWGDAPGCVCERCAAQE